MPNIPDANTQAELTNREITNLIRDLINSRPGLNRLVTSVAVDDSASLADEAVIIVRVSRSGVGAGGGNVAGTSPGQAKTKIVGDETFAESDGPSIGDMLGQPQGVTNE
jgi:hypothetical protein